jgi:hypothetical protein
MLATLLAAAVLAATTAPTADNGDYAMVEAGRLQAHLEFIASDELEGRDTPSRGLDLATLYVAAQLRLYGVEPAGEAGTYFQALRFETNTVDHAASRASVGDEELVPGTDFLVQSAGAPVRGEAVYVGRGWAKADGSVDPYAGLDLKGKVAVAVMGGPEGGPSPRRAPAGWKPPGAAAAERGAVGLVLVPSSDWVANWAARSKAPSRAARPALAPAGAQAPDLPTVVLSKAAVERLFEGGPIAPQALLAAEPGQPLPTPAPLFNGKTVAFSAVGRREVRTANNVVGIVRGSDPAKAHEMVAFGAHIDHIGTATGDQEDKVYNGADDDGSGTVAILEIARAFSLGRRPKRSALFVWHCGEEKGLLGSSHFVENPTVKLADIVAQLNIDMIGRSRAEGDANPRNAGLTGPDAVYVVGSNKMSSDLFQLSERVNDGFLKLEFDYKYDDPNDRERIFFRSDHYNYARKGIPIVFFFSGIHAEYHHVDDEVGLIDFAKLEKVARTVYATGWALANAPSRPKVDKPLAGG